MGIFEKLTEKIFGEEGEGFKDKISKALDGCAEKIRKLKPC